MEIIAYLGNKLAEKIDISPPAARGLLKLSIKDELDPFKPVPQITFNELKTVIENALNKRLRKLEISNKDEIIKFMLGELRKNQSLITMSKV